jgi:hypothetical protein
MVGAIIEILVGFFGELVHHILDPGPNAPNAWGFFVVWIFGVALAARQTGARCPFALPLLSGMRGRFSPGYRLRLSRFFFWAECAADSLGHRLRLSSAQKMSPYETHRQDVDATPISAHLRV